MVKILIVDDEAHALKILRIHLQAAGYDVQEAAGGEAALKAASDKPEDLDLILLDYMMPDLNGMEVLQRLKEKRGLQHIPVVIQTAKTGGHDVYESVDSGAVSYIFKPYTREELLDMVKGVLTDADAIKRYAKVH